MEAVFKLADQYKTELSDDYTMLRIQARLLRTELENQIRRYQQKIEQLQPRMLGQKSRVMDTVTNMSPASYDADKVLQTFTWSGLLLSATAISGLMSAYFFSFFIGIVMSGFAAAVCAYIVLPLMVHHYISKSSTGKYAWNEMILRHALLGFAVIEGFLAGYVLSERAIASTPPLAALTPITIGVGAQVLHPTIDDNRSFLLAATVGGSFALHMLIGTVLGLSFAYVLLAVIYTAIGLVSLQLFIANVNENTVFTHTYQFAILYLTLLSQFVVYQLFGGKPDYIHQD